MNRQLEQLLERLEPGIRKAFLAALADIRAQAIIGALIAALQAGDVEAAVAAMGIERPAFNQFEGALTEAFHAGGLAGLKSLPGRIRRASGVVIRFDIRNLRAEQYLAENSAGLVTRIVEEQRVMLRETLRQGMREGVNPRNLVTGIAGRVNRATGRREGGIVGLTPTQAGYVRSARTELRQLDSSYFSRKLRDRRFDATVRRAIREERPLTAAQIGKIAERYNDRMLAYRAEVIARTEALQSLHAGRMEGMRQGLAATNYRPEDVVKVWRSAGDSRVRDQHREMNGQTVKGLETPFATPDGSQLQFPCDPAAPVHQIAQCRCSYDMRIDFSAGVS